MDGSSAVKGISNGTSRLLSSGPDQEIAILFDARYYVKYNPDVLSAGIDPLEHFLLFGFSEGRSPHPLFDIHYYLEQTRDQILHSGNAFLHFLEEGGLKRLSPHPLFDPHFYIAQANATMDEVTNPLVHFLRIGASQTLSPHPLFNIQYYHAQACFTIDDTENPLIHFLENGRSLSPHPLFDRSYYLQALGDGASAADNPLIHYLTVGDKLGVNPSPLFDTRLYQAMYPDVLQSGLNTLVHYETIGRREGREIRAVRTLYANQTTKWATQTAALASAPTAFTQINQITLLEEPTTFHQQIANLFDAPYYRYALRDRGVDSSTMSEHDLLDHFLSNGRALGLGPFSLFDPDFYVDKNPDVRSSGLDPLEHWMSYGKKEGRSPHPLIAASSVGPELDPQNPSPQLYHPLFDAEYYCKLAKIDPASDQPLLHYLSTGVQLGLTPNRHFDSAFYRSQCDCGETIGAPFLHYIARGAAANLSPVRLFSPAYYAKCNPGLLVEEVFCHFIRSRARRAPHPLIDLGYYAKNARLSPSLTDVEVLTHLIRKGAECQTPFHPAFDIEHYIEQRPCSLWKGATALDDYLEEGWLAGVSPHPLFDPAHYISTARPPKSIPPFLHFLSTPSIPGIEPNYLLHETRSGDEQNLIDRWLRGDTQNNDPQVTLFDEDYYRSQILKRNIPVRPDVDLLSHYLHVGFGLDLSPNRLFMPAFYRQQSGIAADVDAFQHYWKGGFCQFPPHPAIDLDYYELNNPGFDRAKEPVLSHFLRCPDGMRPSPHPFFDPHYYLSIHPDLAQANICPVRHFLEYGVFEERRPNTIFSRQYAGERPGHTRLNISTPLIYQFMRTAQRPLRLVFVSHDSTRTGAPAIILRVLEEFSRFTNVECFTILARGGERTSEFLLFSHTCILNKGAWEAGYQGELAKPDIESFLALLSDNLPVAAFVNSAESRHVGHLLKEAGIPVISLIHELADFYEPSEFEWIYRFSDLVVFPSRFVEASAAKAVGLTQGKTMVRGQGILRRDFGQRNRDRARAQVLKEFGLPDDCVLVMGCGSVDQRKGIDYFVSIAKKCLTRGHSPIAFVWIGDGLRHSTSPWSMAQMEIRSGGLERWIQLAGSREDVEPYFVAADLFLLTSRGDPFPCVVHEAMAAGLPCIAFAGGGGAPELIGDSGIIVPLGDVEAAADAVAMLCVDTSLRVKLSARAKERLRQSGSFYDYFQFFAQRLEDVTGIPIAELGEWRGYKPGERPPIFFLQENWSISGVNTFTKEFVSYLRSRGYPVEVLFTGGMSHLAYAHEEALVQDLPIRFLQPLDWSLPAHWARLLQFLESVGACVVIPNFEYRGSAVTSALPDRVGVIGIAHSDHVEHYEHIHRLGRYWNKIVAVSTRIATTIEEDIAPSLTSKTSVIPYGVPWSESAFPCYSQRKNENGDSIHLVYAGRFVVEQKNIYEYLKLADRLLERRVPFVMHLCGDGPEFEAFSRKAGAHIRAGRIRTPGRLNGAEMDAVYAQSHVLLVLSDYEGLPLAMLEGMARGCIPVCYQIDSGIGEVVRTNYNGFIVPHRDVEAAADVIEMLQDKSRQDTLSVNAFNTIGQAGLRSDDMGERYRLLIDQVYMQIASCSFARPRSLTLNSHLRGIVPSPFGFQGLGST